MALPPSQGNNRPLAIAKTKRRLSSSAAGKRVASGRQSWWRSPWLAVLGGGLLMGLTPAPLNAWPLAWIALVPLWRAVVNPEQSPTVKTLFGLGSLWSFTYHGIVLSWITHLHPLTWMGVPWLASLAIALFAWAFITGLGTVTFGFWAVLLRQLSDRGQFGPMARIVAGTALWCALETALSWGPLAWPFLGFTQSPGNLWILHLGQLAGPMAVTAAIVAVNGCWAEMSLSPLAARAQAQMAREQLGWAGLILLVGLHGIGGALYRQPLADRPETVLKIGLIQGNVPTRVKLTPAGTRQAIAAYVDGYRDLVSQGAEAVLTPEGAIPEVWTAPNQLRSPIRQAVIEQAVVLWLGTFRPVTPGSSQTLTQSLVNLTAQGQVSSQYNKVKLVPLGEYIPFEATLGRIISRLSPVSSSLLPGRLDQVFDTPFGRATIGICYESAYSDLFRQQTAKGGEWIMTASNNDPYPPHMMMQHHAQDVMRAIESDRWSVRVTNTGISGLVDPHGRTLWLSEPNQYVTYLTQIYRRQSLTPYVRWSNWLTYTLLATTVIIAGQRFRKNV
ncbi:MAG: apolipoprotein N-acyltransferase [Cyanobacteria bacterium P01_D01_bin.115]